MPAVIVALVFGFCAAALVVLLVTRGLRRRSPAVTQSRPSLQSVLSSRRHGEFIARRDQLSQYRENLARPVDDERRWSLLNIHGDAGIGKTYLTKQLRQIANGSGHLTAYIDNNFYDVASVMTAIAEQFSVNGVPLTEFEAAAAAYQRRPSTPGDDISALDGIAELATTIVVNTGLSVLRTAPHAVILPDSADAVIAEQANVLRENLTKALKNRHQNELPLAPADKLTRIFVDNATRAAGDRPISLFFDGYERTAPWLDRWLTDLHDGRYGDLPGTLITTISGRYTLDPERWSAYGTITADMYLERFSDAEARQFMVGKNITGERVVAEILKQSDRIPMMLATLAGTHPKDPGDVGDPGGDPVKRYVGSESDQARCDVAAAGALGRTFNRDTLAAVASSDNTSADHVAESFGWLIGLPFVSRQAGSWQYHECVRSAMLRFQREQSPRQWRAEHLALARAHAQWATEVAGGPDPAWANPHWVHHTVEQTYHLLCADPINNRRQALAAAVKAAASKIAHARQWAELIADAGRDADDDDLIRWGTRLRESIKDRDLTQYLTCLIEDGRLSESTLAAAFCQRGEAHLRASGDEQALADFIRATELDPGLASAVAGRGLAYFSLDRPQEALADFERALELDPRLASAIAGRALICLQTGRLLEALTEFSRAIERDPELDWALCCRGLVQAMLGHPDEALADVERASELDPHEAAIIVVHAIVHAVAGRPAEALAELERAEEHDPGETSIIVLRSMVMAESGRLDEALAGLTQAMERDPGETRIIAVRGMVRAWAGRLDEALADFDCAIERNPDRFMPLMYRGTTHLWLSQLDEALADFKRVLELAPDFCWALAARGEVYLELGRLDEALADLDRALELDPDNAETFADRGQTHYKMKHYEEALLDLDRALELDPDLARARASRRLVYVKLLWLDDAFDDLQGVDQLPQLQAFADLGFRMQTYWEVSHAEEVFADLSLTECDPDNEEHRSAVCALLCYLLGYFDEALGELNHIIELNPDNVRYFFIRSFICLQTGRRDEALTDFNRARELKPELVYPPELIAASLGSLAGYGVLQRGQARQQVLMSVGLGPVPDQGRQWPGKRDRHRGVDASDIEEQIP
jgi:tetratricopeptide (TPR) repeat protein